MKKIVSFTIVLCILLSSFVFTYATDYTYDNYSDFVTAVNNNFGYDWHTPNLYITSIPSDFQSLYDDLISYYNPNNKIEIVFSSTSSYRCVSIATCANKPLYSYFSNLALNSTYAPYHYIYTTPNTYSVVYHAKEYIPNGSITYSLTENTGNSFIVSAPNQNSLRNQGSFKGYLLVGDYMNVSPSSSYTDQYIYDANSGGGGGSDPGEYDGLPYSTFTNPIVPSDMNNIPSSYVPYSYQVYQDLLNSPSYDPTDSWQPFRVMLGTFPTMWEYYQRWFYGNHFKYMDDILTAMEGLSTMSDNIQLLADVYASPEEVEARNFAAENQQAVVDNFIDPEGSGAASASDFETISDLSDGFKNTFSSDADPAGIFDLFNSSNLGWFSQETLNQLDTSNNNRKSGSHVDTPLLDQQVEEIYSRLGVKYAH